VDYYLLFKIYPVDVTETLEEINKMKQVNNDVSIRKNGITPSDESETNLERGVQVVKCQLQSLSSKPGVYRMLGADGDVLYVGKANNLKKRVVSYTVPTKISHRITRMISETFFMEIVNTHTEVEALLLESNLIKRLKPKFNILLRDDKSFPHIFISSDQNWPVLTKHRGKQTKRGHYYGPFASAGAVNRSITALQRAFLLRNCSDTVFQNRKRPCLQYQIKRCAAPCVNFVTPSDYNELVYQAKSFLSGDSVLVQKTLAARMQEASEALEFEAAAIYRNRIQALSQIQSHQDINIQGVSDADIIALNLEGGVSCIQVFFFRSGSNYGNHAYFPTHDKTHTPDEILSSFLGQFYDNKTPPKELLISHTIIEAPLLAEALSIRARYKVKILKPTRGVKRKLIEHALMNAREALTRRRAETLSNKNILDHLAKILHLEKAPERIEVYDNSHIQGTNSVGAMIVSGLDGFIKNSYRKFNIKNLETKKSACKSTIENQNLFVEGSELIKPGDDYAMMRQVLHRRFSGSINKDNENNVIIWPDLVVIDGGPGQLSSAMSVVRKLGIENIPFLAISKGPDRNAGKERFHQPGKAPFSLPDNDPVLYYLQRLRDEAHRFAIETHRARRSKNLLRSGIDDIPSVGAKRKKLLLYHFGSIRAVSKAGLEDLELVEGVSRGLAKRIYDYFH
jgi:excinuclease ABC subunit C